jgi:hypothetical protein
VLDQVVPVPEYEAEFPASKLYAKPLVTTPFEEIFGALLTITVKVSLRIAPSESLTFKTTEKVFAGTAELILMLT